MAAQNRKRPKSPEGVVSAYSNRPLGERGHARKSGHPIIKLDSLLHGNDKGGQRRVSPLHGNEMNRKSGFMIGYRICRERGKFLFNKRCEMKIISYKEASSFDNALFQEGRNL